MRGVLIVDDESVHRDRLLQILKRVDAGPVFIATHGNEALEILRNNKAQISLVVCDLQMPGMDGMEVLRRIGETQSDASVIISSSHDLGILRSVELMAKAVGLNVLGSLRKPVDASALEKLLERSRRAPVFGTRPRQVELGSADVDRAFANGEFESHFQPKVDLETGELKGVEALARWNHPTYGLLRPVDFLSMIESLDKLPELTEAITRRSLEYAAAWPDHFRNLNLSINLSLGALHNRAFCEDMQALLATFGIAPENVTFEILESAGMTDIGRTLETMSRLRLNGFGLAIDDFGTGFSSFEQLSRIPFTELKIDRSFVNGVAQSPRQAAVVRSCIELSQRLNLTAVAEGVESTEDWDFLVRTGAHAAQGYLIAKPMPADQLHAWAADWASERNADRHNSFGTK